MLTTGGLQPLSAIPPRQEVEPTADNIPAQTTTSRGDRFYITEAKANLSEELRMLTIQAFSKSLPKETWQGLLENYPALTGTESLLNAPTMEAGMKEEIRKRYEYHKTKEVFAFDDVLADKQGAFLIAVRPILAALTALDNPSEDDDPDPDLIKGMLEDALVLLGNANVRLNSWRQRRFSEYLTEIGKRTLKEEIPSDQHLFPDRFHDRIKDEHNHTATNKSLISKPDRPPQAGKFVPFRQPFRGRSSSSPSGSGRKRKWNYNRDHSTGNPKRFQPRTEPANKS